MQTLVPPHASAVVSKVVVESHRHKQPHQSQKFKKKCECGKSKCDHNITYVTRKCRCDLAGCKISPNTKVVRALSRVFTVNSKKTSLASRIVLAEVRLADFKSVAAAKRAVRKLAVPVRPLKVDILAKIKRPMALGYGEDEIFTAMRPYIGRHARMYSNNNFPMEDAEQEGWRGIRSAINTDRAIAPFATHAYLHIRTKVRRPIYEGGLIKHGEREADSQGTKGGLLAFKWICKQCGDEWNYNHEDKVDLSDEQREELRGIENERDREEAKRRMLYPECIGSRCEDNGNVEKIKVLGSLTSVDAELGDSFSLKDAMACEEPGPLEIVMEKDAQEFRRGILDLFILGSSLSDQQLDTMERLFGLNGKEQLSGTEAAKAIGNSRQRVGQQLKKCKEKLKAAADELGYDFDMLEMY